MFVPHPPFACRDHAIAAARHMHASLAPVGIGDARLEQALFAALDAVIGGRSPDLAIIQQAAARSSFQAAEVRMWLSFFAAAMGNPDPPDAFISLDLDDGPEGADVTPVRTPTESRLFVLERLTAVAEFCGADSAVFNAAAWTVSGGAVSTADLMAASDLAIAQIDSAQRNGIDHLGHAWTPDDCIAATEVLEGWTNELLKRLEGE